MNAYRYLDRFGYLIRHAQFGQRQVKQFNKSQVDIWFIVQTMSLTVLEENTPLITWRKRKRSTIFHKRQERAITNQSKTEIVSKANVGENFQALGKYHLELN